MGVFETTFGIVGAVIVAVALVSGLVICLKWIGEKAIDKFLDVIE